ncbi:hypothetical protein JQM69_11905, partial [Faecalicatena contorta]|nr:hypothetical protein [Faecalicatena contorta]MCF2680222.1 hypothetical protein [Faecalicatena contorta]MCF2681370.1 hypothetical protein [Faecalicatena contorta]
MVTVSRSPGKSSPKLLEPEQQTIRSLSVVLALIDSWLSCKDGRIGDI